jgi:hypothetical protein
MNKLTRLFAIAAALAFAMTTATAFARGGDHPSGIPDKPITVQDAKAKLVTTDKLGSTNRPTKTLLPTPRSSS